MNPPKLNDSVRLHLDAYFTDLGDTEPAMLYDMLMDAVERPLLEMVMARADGNQSKAAAWLGLNRNTLRRKLLAHGMLDA